MPSRTVYEAFSPTASDASPATCVGCFASLRDSAGAALVRVHRLVGAGHRHVGVVTGLQLERAVGKADRNRLAVPRRRRGAQLLGQDIGFLVRLGLVGVAQHHAELVASEAADAVAIADI